MGTGIGWRGVVGIGATVVGLAAVVPSGSLGAQEAGEGGATVREAGTAPGVRAGTLDGPIELDGALDEAGWARAESATGFVQFAPDEGQAATERTDVRVLVDDGALWVGAMLHDRDPDAIIARLGRRDDPVQADWFYVYVDGHRDRRSAFGFGVSAAGVQRDLRISDDERRDASWDAVWASEVRRTDTGWSVEMRIPLSQLRFAEGGGDPAWGVNFERILARRNETAYWSPILQGTGSFVSLFGELSGVSDVEPRRRIEVIPYSVARVARAPGSEGNPLQDPTERSAAVGADVRVGLGPSLTLSATLNPDFDQVEGDAAVLNLTAFETFQQERRPFFVEGADIFSPSFPTWPPLFYSRRIGRAPQVPTPSDAEHVDRPASTTILGALKLSGRTEGGWSIGVLGAATPTEEARLVREDGRQDRATVEPATRYGVARVTREFREGRSGLGILATALDRRLGDDPRMAFLRENAFAVGLDGYHRFADDGWETRAAVQASHVRGDTSAIRRTQMAPGHYFQRSDAGHVELDPERTSLSGISLNVNVRKLRGSWKTGAFVRATSPGFEVSDLGFNPTLDHVMGNAYLRYESYTPGPLFRSWNVGTTVMAQTDTEGRVQELTQDLGFNFELPSYWGGGVWIMRHAPAWTPTHLRGGPALRKSGRWMGSFDARSDSRRTVTGRGFLFWEIEDETDGYRVNANATLAVRPSQRMSLEVGPSLMAGREAWQYVGRPEGVETALVGSMDRRTLGLTTRLDYTLSPTLSLQLLGRPFVASVDYDGFREVTDPAARSFGERFRDLAVDRTERPGADRLALDRNGDGTADVEIADPSFTTSSIQANAVLRWEYRPGSTLYAVWTHDRDVLARDDVASRWDRLRSASGRSVFMLKASWWLGL